jgi:pimeloyl-ACP methyl ester carboxylesterase
MSTDSTTVLIHGLWMSTRSREHAIPRYERHGYRVIAPAYPGFEDYKEFSGRDHYTSGAPGGQQVADYARTWATEHVPWSKRVIARRHATGS